MRRDETAGAIRDDADLAAWFLGITQATARDLLAQADRYAAGQSAQPAQLIVTTRTPGLGELVSESLWQIERQPEGGYVARLAAIETGAAEAAR
jgi:hypothetical protein